MASLVWLHSGGPRFIPYDNLQPEALILNVVLVQKESDPSPLCPVCVCQLLWPPLSTDLETVKLCSNFHYSAFTDPFPVTMP